MVDECPRCGGEVEVCYGPVEVAGKKYDPGRYESCVDCIWVSLDLKMLTTTAEEKIADGLNRYAENLEQESENGNGQNKS